MKSRLIVSVALVMAPMIAPFAACSDTSGSAPDGSDDAGGREASHDDYFVPPDEHDSGPIYNKDGWIRLDFPDPACNFFAAPSPDKMPPPIAWEPCDDALLAQGWACRKVKFNWAPPTDALRQMMGPVEDAWVDDNGKAWIALRPNTGALRLNLVAEVDGPVHAAVSQAITRSCQLTDEGLSGHNVIFYARQTEPIDTGGYRTIRTAALGGSVDKIPALLESENHGIDNHYFAGPNAYLAYVELTLHSWTPGGPSAHLDEQDPGQVGMVSFVGDTVFFPVGNLMYHRIKVYTPADGLRDFVSFGNDMNAGASDFGTDGVDMVWTEAAGTRTAEMDRWTTINIMKAPYTSDPTKIQKTRLRSEPYSFGANPFTVGCGYAAHWYSTDTESGTRLIRLSDGVSWRFKKLSDADGGTAAIFTGPLAITCDEVFLGYYGGPDQVARIRLDSLGPGDPPD